MNSASAPMFRTSDNSPWWLRAAASTEPKGTYHKFWHKGSVRFCFVYGKEFYRISLQYFRRLRLTVLFYALSVTVTDRLRDSALQSAFACSAHEPYS